MNRSTVARLVIFSGHPERSGETLAMLRDAVLWAAKVTGVENSRQEAEAKEAKR